MSSVIGYWQAGQEISVPRHTKTVMVGETSDLDAFIYLPSGVLDEFSRLISTKSPIFIPEGADGNERIVHLYDCDIDSIKPSNLFSFQPRYHFEFFTGLVSSSLFRSPKIYRGKKLIGLPPATTWNLTIPAFGRKKFVMQVDNLDATFDATIDIYGVNIGHVNDAFKIQEFQRFGEGLEDSETLKKNTLITNDVISPAALKSYEYENSFSAYIVNVDGGGPNFFVRLDD